MLAIDSRRALAAFTIALVVCVGAFCSTTHAALDVFVDFTSDIGNGNGGGANGTADWIDNLNKVTTAASVPAFTPAERTTIETGIVSQLQTMYSSYNVTFHTTVPGGAHERINFGAFDATPGSLGVAPLDFQNLAKSSGSEGSAARVFSNNFSFIIEPADARATVITEVTTALAGTGGHELGHSVGVQHHHSYGDPAIGPANYANTGGVQNSHIMATGSTGLSETGRESLRNFSQWENLQIEAAGGGNLAVRGAGNTGTSLATTVLQESDSFSGPDVGNTTATAKTLTLTPLTVSQLNASNTLGTLNSNADVDVYKFAVPGASRILADVWTQNAYADSFDSLLRLYSTDGTTVLAFNDDTTYDEDAIYDGTAQSLDSSLLNVMLPTAGTYFLEVSAFSNLGGAVGGVYNLIFGIAAVPELSSVFAWGLIMATISWAAGTRRKLSALFDV